MIHKNHGASYEAFPGLSGIMPFALCSEKGLLPKATQGEMRSRRIPGLMTWTFFHTKYGTLFGLAAEEGEN